MKKKYEYCLICNNFLDLNVCKICDSVWRNRSQICIVENDTDIVIIEELIDYIGLFHILHGSLSPRNGIGPDKLFISNLFPRLTDENTQSEKILEVYLAVHPTYESQITANYMENIIKPLGIQIERIEINKSDKFTSEIVN